MALELAVVVKVLPMIYTEPQPGAPQALIGFANLSRTPVPVIRLRTLFELPASSGSDDLDHRIVLCEVGGEQLGLVLDEALSMVRPSSLRGPSSQEKSALPIVRSIGVVDDALCALLDPQAALSWLDNQGLAQPGVS